MRVLLALLALATRTAQWTQQIELSVPAGNATLTFSETDDVDRVAEVFVRAHGITDGAGCTADAACVARRIAERLRASSPPMIHLRHFVKTGGTALGYWIDDY